MMSKPPVIEYRGVDPPPAKVPAGPTVSGDPLKLAIGLSVMLLAVIVLVALVMGGLILGF
jgi:hypothetical protein